MKWKWKWTVLTTEWFKTNCNDLFCSRFVWKKLFFSIIFSRKETRFSSISTIFQFFHHGVNHPMASLRFCLKNHLFNQFWSFFKDLFRKLYFFTQFFYKETRFFTISYDFPAFPSFSLSIFEHFCCRTSPSSTMAFHHPKSSRFCFGLLRSAYPKRSVEPQPKLGLAEIST